MAISRALSIASILAAFATPALSYDFSEADSIFGRRTSDDVATILQAREAYSRALGAPDLSRDEKIYAATQIARLDYHRGEILLPKSAHEERKPIFRACEETLEASISAERIGPSPEFYYHMVRCMALRGEVATDAENIERTPKLKRMVEAGMALDTRVEGGGLKRTVALIYVNPRGRLLGLYHPDRAVVLAEEAIASEPIVDRAYPVAHGGTDFYSNYDAYAKALKEVGRRAEALQTLDDAIQLIEDMEQTNSLPAGLERETSHDKSTLQRTKAEIEGTTP